MALTLQKLILLFGLLGLTWAGAAHAAPISDPLKNFYVTDGQVDAIATVGGLVYVGGAFSMVNRYSGGGVVLDNTAGAADPDWPAVNGPVLAVQKDGQGGWYIGGNFTVVGTVARNGLAHILSDKSVDPNWDPNPNPNPEVRALLKVGHTLYVGGMFENLNGAARSNLAAFDTTTGELTDWDPNVDDPVDCLAKSGSWLYVGGEFSRIGGVPSGTTPLNTRNHIARVSTSSPATVDPNWDPNADNRVRTILVSGNTVYVGGSFANIGGQARSHLAALSTTTGLAAPNWDPNVGGTAVFALALSETTLYVGGGFANVGGQLRDHIAAVSTTGTGAVLDWNPGAQSGDVRSILLVGKRVYIGGGFTIIGRGPGADNGTPRDHLAAVNATTGKVTAWNPQANDSVYTLVKFQQTLFTGGAFTSVGAPTPRNNIAAFDATTGLVSSVDLNADHPVHALTVFGNTLYLAGEFTTLQGGTQRNRLASLDTSTPSPTFTDWNPGADGTVWAIAVSPNGSFVYVGGDFAHAGNGLPPRSRIASLDSSSGNALDWNPGTSGGPFGGRVSALATTSNKLYAGGSFTTIGGLSRAGLAFLVGTGTTGLVQPWDPSPDGPVYTILVGGVTPCSTDAGLTPTIYFGGDFTQLFNGTLNGATGIPVDRRHIAAVKSTSSTVNVKICNWNPGTDGTVRALARSGDTMFLGGDFMSAGGLSRNHLAAVDVGRNSANEWNPGADNSVHALAVLDSLGLPGMLYAGGSFATITGSNPAAVGLPRTNLAAFAFPTLDSMISPLSRSVPINDASYPAVALLVVHNHTSLPATQVSIAKKSAIGGSNPPLHFYTYDGTNCVSPDTAVDIPPLGQKTFCVSIVPDVQIPSPLGVTFGIEGTNTTAARNIAGWSSLTLIASNPPPQTTADIFTSTSETDGIVSFPESIKNPVKNQPPCLGQATFDAGSFNLGGGQTITASLRGIGGVSITTPTSTGSVSVGICQLSSGQCLASPAASVTLQSFDAYATPAFRVFITGEVGKLIPGDFEADRLFIDFKDNTAKLRGQASMVLQTVGTASCP
ncbi:MAG: hypothetical protein HY268_07110 [Deltaproteobacteria bacterium]|nr:hypothetical protein [Deltaproteobacteria bacterium]